MSSGPKNVEASHKPRGTTSAVIYHCRTGAFLSPVAAAVHLGALPAAGAIPDPGKIAQVAYFAQLGRADRGFLHYCGLDGHDREVFIMGDGGRAAILKRAILSAAELAGLDPGRYNFVDCSQASDLVSEAGEWIWQRFAGAGRGKAFLSRQAARVYRRIINCILP